MQKRKWWIVPVMTGVGTVLGLIGAMVVSYVMPKLYESTAVLQIRRSVPSVEVLPGTVTRNPAETDAPFFSTEFEGITSQKTLDKVIDDLDLTNRWNMDRRQARGQLEGMIYARNIRGTDLIEINVRATNPSDAKAIAAAVSEAYRAWRTEKENELEDRALEELREAVVAQEEVVEEKRKALILLIRTENARESARSYSGLEEEGIKLESQIQTLLRYDGERLMRYAAGLNLPENVIRTLYPRYLEAKRELDALQVGGLDANHPKVKRQVTVIEGMRKDLVDGVVALRETLQAQLELVKEQATRLEESDKKGLVRPLGPSIRNGFDEARREFEEAQSLLEQLKIKEIGEQMQRRISEDPVIVHADPVEATEPVSPKVFLNLAIGTGGGMVGGALLGLLMVPLLGSVDS